MLKNNLGRLVAALTAIAALQAAQISPATAKPENCLAYSIQACNPPQWIAKGYASLAECRAQEYDNCINGVPPGEPAAYKPGTPNTIVPARKMVAKQSQPTT